jgi:hypothetical protein
LAVEECHGGLAVADDVEVVMNFAAFEGFACEVHVTGVVFDEKDSNRRHKVGLGS